VQVAKGGAAETIRKYKMGWIPALEDLALLNGKEIDQCF